MYDNDTAVRDVPLTMLCLLTYLALHIQVTLKIHSSSLVLNRFCVSLLSGFANLQNRNYTIRESKFRMIVGKRSVSVFGFAQGLLP